MSTLCQRLSWGFSGYGGWSRCCHWQELGPAWSLTFVGCMAPSSFKTVFSRSRLTIESVWSPTWVVSTFPSVAFSDSLCREVHRWPRKLGWYCDEECLYGACRALAKSCGSSAYRRTQTRHSHLYSSSACWSRWTSRFSVYHWNWGEFPRNHALLLHYYGRWPRAMIRLGSLAWVDCQGFQTEPRRGTPRTRMVSPLA